MPATILAIADAVVATLNAATLSQSFTAERGFVPVLELAADDGLRVFVTTPDLTVEPLSRRSGDLHYGIHVGVFRKLDPGTTTLAAVNTACDPLVALVEEVRDLFPGKRPATHPAAICVTAAVPAVFHHELLETQRLFASLIRLVFREPRARA